MEEPTPLHTKVASILGPASMSGVVSEREGDTDFAQEESGRLQFHMFIQSNVCTDMWQ